MPKYFNFKVGDYYLYFTSQCIVEAMHVHASDKKLTEAGSSIITDELKYYPNCDGTVRAYCNCDECVANEKVKAIEDLSISNKDRDDFFLSLRFTGTEKEIHNMVYLMSKQVQFYTPIKKGASIRKRKASDLTCTLMLGVCSKEVTLEELQKRGMSRICIE